MANFLDNLIGTNQQNLSAHAADSGEAWDLWYQSTGSDILQMYNPGGSYTGVYTNCGSGEQALYCPQWTPPSADYSVPLTLHINATPVGAQIAGVFGRLTSAQNSASYTAYHARYTEGSGIALYKFVAGSATQLGSTYSYSAATNDIMTLDMTGNQITVKLNGSAVIGPITDSAISSAGKMGLWMANGANTSTTGIIPSKIQGISSVTTATAFTLVGPSAGPAGAASANFTVTPVGGNETGTFTPTPVSGCTFSPATLTWSGDAAPKTFTVTKSAAGTVNINGTFSNGLTPPANVSYTAKAVTSRTMLVSGSTAGHTMHVAVKNDDGTFFSDETASGVVDQGGGVFSALLSTPTDQAGIVQWHDVTASTYTGESLYLAPVTSLTFANRRRPARSRN